MSLEKLLIRVIYTGLFLVPFVPLYVGGALFFPFITGKAFFFRIVVEIIFGAWLLLSLYDKSYRPQKTWLFYTLNIFVVVIALADIFSGHFLKSFWSNFERMEGLVTLLHLLAYFYVLTSFVKTERVWDRLLQTSVGVSLIIGGWGFLQLFGHFTSIQSGTRLDASFGNASYLAVYMLFHVFLTSYLFTKEGVSKGLRWLYAIIIAFQAFILIFTQTRGTILGLLGGTLLTFILIALFEKEKVKLKKVSIGVIVGLVALSGIFFLIKDSSLVQSIPPLERISTISIDDRTTTSRFLIWNMAFEGFKEKPVLGWGQESFIFVFEKYYDPKMYAQEPWFDRAHNVFFDWLIAGGLLGLLSYLLIFIFALIALWKSDKLSVVQKSLFVGLLAGYFFHNLFVFDNIASYVLFISTLALIDFNSRDPETINDSGLLISQTYTKALTPIVILVVIFALYFLNVKGVMANKALLQALAPQEEGVGKNLELYKKALSYDTYGNQEIREQLLNAASSIVTLEVPVEIKNDFVTLAREEMQKQIDNNPKSARHNVFMGSFLNRLRLYDEAIPFLEKALESSPKKQPIYFEFVTNYINSGNTQKAMEFARDAYELAPEFDTARVIYATTLIYNNNSQEAERLLEERFGERFFGDQRLASAYFTTNQFDKAVQTWRNLIEREPNNIQNRISLAATLLEAGRRSEAVGELRKAIEIEPSFKEQGEFFISEIEAGRNP